MPERPLSEPLFTPSDPAGVTSEEPRRRFAYGGQLALLFVVYFVTAKLGLRLDAVSGFATLVWPPTGIALAALLLFGQRLWPAVTLGAFVVNLTTGAPILVACGMATGNTLEAIVGTYLLERVFQFEPSVGHVHDVVALAGAAALASAISASIGVASLWVGGILHASSVAATWEAWCIGDVLGVLIVTPLVLAWRAEPRIPTQRGLPAEVVALGVIIVLVALYVFDVIFPRSHPDNLRWPYLIYPGLIWASLRFRQRGAATGTVLVWIVSTAATAFGLGPFAAGRLSESLLPLQIFMGVAALTTLFLSAAISERDLAIRARDVFLGVVSHELRTPLTSLELQLSNLRRTLEDGRNEPVAADKVLPKVQAVEQQSARFAGLVENLLDVSRLTSGRFDLTVEELDLREVARELTARFRDQAAKAGCDLLVALDEPCAGRWDRLRVEQVLTNLLANAIKFGQGKPIRVALVCSPITVSLSVRDQGIGIAQEDHDRVFERFGQAASNRHYVGLGLGLWIARQIVTAMGGSIAIKSELGAGAEFTVTLPRTPLSRLGRPHFGDEGRNPEA